MTASSHLGDQLQDFLDGRLDEADRSRVEAHVTSCAQCRRELDALRWVRTAAREQLPVEEVPAALSSRVRASLNAEDAKSRSGTARRAISRPTRWAVAAAVVAAAVLLLVFVPRRTAERLPELVARDFASYAGGRAPLDIEARDPQVIEAFFARNGVRFTTRVFDLGMMRYDLLGGRVHRLGRGVSALFAYRGSDGRFLVCQMYEGAVAALPPPDETRENNGITFQVYREGTTTVVFWQEGDVVCVLASDAALETVMQLAYAKAVKV